MSRSAPQKLYTGLLAEPMYKPSLISADTEVQEWAEMRNAKKNSLFRHFEIDPVAENSWENLAIALAEQHVPGFRPPPPKRGVPMDYKFAFTLMMRVELIKRRDKLRGRPALDKIADAKFYNQNAEALRSRYREALKNPHLKNLMAMFERIAERLGENGLIECFEYALGEQPE